MGMILAMVPTMHLLGKYYLSYITEYHGKYSRLILGYITEETTMNALEKSFTGTVYALSLAWHLTAKYYLLRQHRQQTNTE